jgi:hypothetical protein
VGFRPLGVGCNGAHSAQGAKDEDDKENASERLHFGVMRLFCDAQYRKVEQMDVQLGDG